MKMAALIVGSLYYYKIYNKKVHYNTQHLAIHCKGLFYTNPDLVQAPFLIKISRIFVLQIYITQISR